MFLIVIYLFETTTRKTKIMYSLPGKIFEQWRVYRWGKKTPLNQCEDLSMTYASNRKILNRLWAVSQKSPRNQIWKIVNEKLFKNTNLGQKNCYQLQQTLDKIRDYSRILKLWVSPIHEKLDHPPKNLPGDRKNLAKPKKCRRILKNSGQIQEILARISRTRVRLQQE